MPNVGSKRLFENDHVVVWQFDLAPGDQSAVHTHTLDYVVRVISGSTVQALTADGDVLYTVERQPGETVNFRIDGDQILTDRPAARPIPATHRARNVGDATFREVLIEFKRQSDEN